MGTLYADNNIVAWGNVAAGTSATIADVGVGTVTFAAPNTYTIQLNSAMPTGTVIAAWNANQCAIVATPTEDGTGGPCIVTVTPVTPLGTFKVNTWTAGGAATAGCGFMFHVIIQ